MKDSFLLSFFVLAYCPLFSQVTLTYTSVLDRYDYAIKDLNGNLSSLDSSWAHKINRTHIDLEKEVIAADTESVKIFLSDHTDFANSLTQKLKDGRLTSGDKLFEVNRYYTALEKESRDATYFQLVSCSNCFFSRNIQVVVLRRQSDVLMDTVKCAGVSLAKMMSSQSIGRKRELNSFPCPESKMTVSIGPTYHFIVKDNNQDYPFDRPIESGYGEDDIQVISLILPTR